VGVEDRHSVIIPITVLKCLGAEVLGC